MGELALALPWSSDRRAAGTSRYAGHSPGTADAAVRDDIALGVAFDVGNIAAARQSGRRDRADKWPLPIPEPALARRRAKRRSQSLTIRAIS